MYFGGTRKGRLFGVALFAVIDIRISGNLYLRILQKIIFSNDVLGIADYVMLVNVYMPKIMKLCDIQNGSFQHPGYRKFQGKGAEILVAFVNLVRHINRESVVSVCTLTASYYSLTKISNAIPANSKCDPKLRL